MIQFTISFVAISVVMAFAILAVLVLKAFFPNIFTAKLRYAVWVILLIGLVIPIRPMLGEGLLNFALPSVNAAYNEFGYTGLFFYSGEPIQIAEPSVAFRAVEPDSRSISPVVGIAIIAIIWAAVAVLVFAFHIWRYIRFSLMVKRWSETIDDGATLSNFRSIMEEKGLKNKKIELRVCNFISTSMLLGFFRPMILLPDKVLDADELELVFRHELTHYKRGDVFVKLLSVFALSLNWFNPAVYIMSAEMQADCEASCDEAVLADVGGENRQFYAELIMEMIGDKRSGGTLLSSCFYGSKRGVRIRMEAIMSETNHVKKFALSIPAAIIMITVFAGSVFAFNLQGSEFNISRSEALDIVLQSMDITIDQISDLVFEDEWMNGEFAWEFYFILDNQLHNIYVHSMTGEIIFPYTRISGGEAIAAAAAFVNAELSDVRVFEKYMNVFSGTLVWDIAMEANGALNEFMIDIYTAEVLQVRALDFLP